MQHHIQNTVIADLVTHEQQQENLYQVITN